MEPGAPLAAVARHDTYGITFSPGWDCDWEATCGEYLMLHLQCQRGKMLD